MATPYVHGYGDTLRGFFSRTKDFPHASCKDVVEQHIDAETKLGLNGTDCIKQKIAQQGVAHGVSQDVIMAGMVCHIALRVARTFGVTGAQEYISSLVDYDQVMRALFAIIAYVGFRLRVPPRNFNMVFDSILTDVARFLADNRCEILPSRNPTPQASPEPMRKSPEPVPSSAQEIPVQPTSAPAPAPPSTVGSTQSSPQPDTAYAIQQLMMLQQASVIEPDLPMWLSVLGETLHSTACRIPKLCVPIKFKDELRELLAFTNEEMEREEFKSSEPAQWMRRLRNIKTHVELPASTLAMLCCPGTPIFYFVLAVLQVTNVDLYRFACAAMLSANTVTEEGFKLLLRGESRAVRVHGVAITASASQSARRRGLKE